MNIFHAWLFLLLFFSVTEFPALLNRSMSSVTIFQHFAAWANPKTKSFGYNARRSAWVVFLVYLVYQSVKGIF